MTARETGAGARRARRGAALLAACLALAGCASAISPAVRREAEPVKGLEEIRGRLEAYRGKTVILGGEVVETRNRPEATTLVILEKPLTASQKPRPVDETGGRLLARFSRYLDPVLFAKGRLVTLAGVVAGEATEPVGEAPYRYVVLDGVEIHLWPERVEAWPDPWYRYPWWYEGAWGTPPW